MIFFSKYLKMFFFSSKDSQSLREKKKEREMDHKSAMFSNQEVSVYTFES